MRLINLTPHAIVLRGVTIPPSGTVARAASHEELVGYIEHPDSDDPESLTTSVPILRQQFSAVTGIPDPVDGVGYRLTMPNFSQKKGLTIFIAFAKMGCKANS